MSVQTLSDIFGERIVGSSTWPARSTDLKLRDSFFRGLVEEKCYSPVLRTREEVKESIRKEIANIAVEQLQTVNQNIFRRCRQGLRVEGQDFQSHL